MNVKPASIISSQRNFTVFGEKILKMGAFPQKCKVRLKDSIHIYISVKANRFALILSLVDVNFFHFLSLNVTRARPVP